MAQLDDDVGSVMKKLKDMGVEDDTIVVFTTDNGTEIFTWPDGGQTPFAAVQGHRHGRRLPRTGDSALAGPCAGGLRSRTASSPAWTGCRPSWPRPATRTSPKSCSRARQIDGRTYKNHLDGYNQMVAITGKGPSARHEIFYFGESTVGAIRIDDYKYRFIDQPQGWLGEKTHVDVPDPDQPAPRSVRAHGLAGKGAKSGAQEYFDWFKYEFWRFVFVQQVMGKALQTFIDYPPMQPGASFNLEAVKAEMAKKMAQAEAAAKGTGQ